jgi:heme/copper-type cytochrome/quinol oxidase subunit 4
MWWYIITYVTIVIIGWLPLNAMNGKEINKKRYSLLHFLYRAVDYVVFKIIYVPLMNRETRTFTVNMNLTIFSIIIYFIILDCYKFIRSRTNKNIYYFGMETRLSIVFKLIVGYLFLHNYYSFRIFKLMVDVLEVYCYYNKVGLNKLIMDRLNNVHLYDRPQ